MKHKRLEDDAVEIVTRRINPAHEKYYRLDLGKYLLEAVKRAAPLGVDEEEVIYLAIMAIVHKRCSEVVALTADLVQKISEECDAEHEHDKKDDDEGETEITRVEIHHAKDLPPAVRRALLDVLTEGEGGESKDDEFDFNKTENLDLDEKGH